MLKTQTQPYVRLAYGELESGTPFVIDDEPTLSPYAAYRRIAARPCGELVRFGSGYYPLNGFRQSSNHRVKLSYSLAPQSRVIAGSAISPNYLFGGYLSEAALEILAKLETAPQHWLPLSDLYPKVSWLKAFSAHSHTHDLIGMLREHEAVEVDGQRVFLTFAGLNRALQHKAGQK